MIEQKKEEDHWEFIFLGANIDAAKEAARFGIDSSRAARYRSDSYGTELNYKVVSNAVCMMRQADTAEDMDAVFEEADVLAPIRENCDLI